ncbi:MAG: hypothetical protein U0931_14305 [Vulcanimicrobiota bacterium]
MDKLTPSLFLMMKNSPPSGQYNAASKPTMSRQLSGELYADDAQTAVHLGDARRHVEDSVSLSPAARQLTRP